MRNIICPILLLFCVFSVTSQVNQGEIIYKKKIKPTQYDSKKYSKSTLKEFEAFEQDIQNSLKLLEFSLVFLKGESVFEARAFLDNGEIGLRSAVGPEGTGIYYTSKDARLHQLDAFGQQMILKLPKVQWKLTNETKKIGAYTCYKATTTEEIPTGKYKKYNVIAWYTPQINVPFGPIGFKGLPGLILELEYRDVIT